MVTVLAITALIVVASSLLSWVIGEFLQSRTSYHDELYIAGAEWKGFGAGIAVGAVLAVLLTGVLWC